MEVDPLDNSGSSTSTGPILEPVVIDRDGDVADDERTSGNETVETEKSSPQRETVEAVRNALDQNNFNSVKGATVTTEQGKPMPINKKHRRGSRRNRRKKYKPYNKLTWEEKKALDERDAKRANLMRQQYVREKGRPIAPYNTTQFLMAEHDLEEPDLHVSPQINHIERQPSVDDSDPEDYYDSPDEYGQFAEEEFLKRDFAETYDQVHAESLYAMSKNKLVQEFMELENRVDIMEKRLRGVSLETLGVKDDHENSKFPFVVNNLSTKEKCDESTLSKDEMMTELRRIKEENRRLLMENRRLKSSNCCCDVPRKDNEDFMA